MDRLAPFAALLLAVTGSACSVEGAPPVATTAASTPSPSPRATTSPSSEPSLAIVPSLVPCPSGGTPESPILLSPEEALTCDLQAMAEGRGTTIEHEYARSRTSLILDEITTRISRERPDLFIGAALSDKPAGPPTLFIKGPADAFIRELVAEAEIEIVIADNQPYSAAEINERQDRIGSALQELGFTNFAVGNDIRTGRFYAAVTIEAGLPTEPDEIVALLPRDLRGDLDLTVSETPVAVDTIPD
jgi:hypothetical protein